MIKYCYTLLFFVLSFHLAGQDEFIVEKLNGGINTSYDEISPVVSIDGKNMYFTRVGYPDFDKTLIEEGKDLSQTLSPSDYQMHLRNIFTKLSLEPIANPVQSGFNQDIWLAQGDSYSFDKIVHPPYPLNNAMPNSVCGFTPSGNELIVINQFNQEGGMEKGFSIVRSDSHGYWSFPEPFIIEDFYTIGPDVNLTMSSDGRVMILSMERRDSYGQNDLYVCFKKGYNRWSAPKNLGPYVNSAAREITPFLSEDTKTLYFSTNRRASLGKNDIFMMYREDDSWERWTYPRRFNAPVNSTTDDTQPYFNSATGYLYFTSTRDGSSDIFRAQIAPPNPITVTIKGRIFNLDSREDIKAKIVYGPAGQDDYKNVYISDDGTYRMSVPKGVRYEIKAVKPGYTGKSQEVFFKKEYVYYKEYNFDLELRTMEAGSKIELEPIYFEQSKPTVLKKSYPAIDKLADFLRENKNIYIVIEGHTDNQGDKDLLQKLSEERAKAVKDYLVYKQRINPIKIETIGYGDSKPVNDNLAEGDRKANRRVEIKITKISESVMTLKDGDENEDSN